MQTHESRLPCGAATSAAGCGAVVTPSAVAAREALRPALTVAPGEVVAVVGAVAAAASRRCSSSSAACRSPTRARVDAPTPARADAPARPAAAVARRARQRRAGAARGRASVAARRASGARPLFERFGLDGLRARAARTSSRAGCASASRSCARCSPGKPVLCLDEPFARARRDHPRARCRTGWPARWPRAAHRPARHPRRRGGASSSPTASSCSRRGPAASSPSSTSPLPRPRRRDRPGARRAARARAGGAAPRDAARRAARSPCAVAGRSLVLLGGWEALRRARRRRRPHPARAARGRHGARRTTARCCGTTSRVTAQEVAARDRCVALVAGVALRGRDAPLAPLRRARLPAARRLAGDPDRRSRAAARRLARLRHRARSSRSSRSSASSRSSSPRSTGWPRVDPDLRKLMRTLGASRWQTLPLRRGCPPRCRRCFTGAKIAVAVAVIGAVFAE